jgi:hypothetical protein
LMACFAGQVGDLGAILRADRPVGGLLAARRNPSPPALLQEV